MAFRSACCGCDGLRRGFFRTRAVGGRRPARVKDHVDLSSRRSASGPVTTCATSVTRNPTYVGLAWAARRQRRANCGLGRRCSPSRLSWSSSIAPDRRGGVGVARQVRRRLRDRSRQRASSSGRNGASVLAAPSDPADPEPAVVLDDQDAFALAQRGDDLGGQAEDSSLFRRAAADDSARPAIGHRVEDARSAAPATSPPSRRDRDRPGASPRGRRPCPPLRTPLASGPRPTSGARGRRSRHVLLAGAAPEDLHHLGGSARHPVEPKG